MSGIALADVDVARLLDAFEAYGFEVDADPTTMDDGANRWRAYADDGQVELAIREVDGTVERVLVADYSAGDVGLDDLGFLAGIFAPEAQDWLIEQAEAAIADPGTPIEETMEFEYVTLVFEAYTDETQSIDLYVQEK